MKQNRFRHLGLSIAPATLALLMLGLPACGSSDDGDPVGGGGTGGTSGGPMQQEDSGEMLTTPVTCTEQHSICMNMVLPSPMEGEPARLVFNFYPSDQPPATLPAGYAGYFTAPSLTPGQHVYFKLTDGGLVGDQWVWVILYMEGGGYGAPVQGVDYGMESPAEKVHLDGTPINIATPVVIGL